MLAYFTPNAQLTRAANCDPASRYFVELLPEDDDNVQQHISSFSNANSYSYNADKKAYAEMLAAGRCYGIVYPEKPKDRSRCNLRFPIPAALVNVVDAQANGTHLRVIGHSLDHAQLRNPLRLGQEVYAVPSSGDYDGRGHFVLEGPEGIKGTVLPMGTTEPWTDTWQNPWQEVVAKVIARCGYGVNTYGINYIIPLAKHGSTGALVLTEGCHAGHSVDAACVVFPATEKEADVFARKVHRPYRLQASKDVHQLIDELGDGYGEYLSWMADEDEWEGQDLFRWGLTPGNYVAVDPADHTRVTYLPQSKVAGVLAKELDPWDNPSRQSTTWGKFAKLMLNEKQFADERSYEAFSTQMVANATELFGPEESKPELLIVSGGDIATYYDGSGYVKGSGSLNGSCMRNCEDTRFELYTRNPDQVSLLICRDRESKLLHGRALLWHHADGSKYVDRRYGTTLQVEARMLNWAEKQGYVDIWGGHHSPKAGVQIQLAEWLFKTYPYMDSMAQLDPRTGIISSVSMSGAKWSEVKNTSGGRTAAGEEKYCAQSSILAPVELLDKTASGDYAMPKYVVTLRSGKKELENRCVEDQLEGGLIAKAEQLTVATKEGGRITSKGNPNIALGSTLDYPHVAHYTKDLLVMSPLDGGFIYKAQAVQQPDGGWCLPATVGKYQAMLARKKVNKARRVTTLVQLEAVAELAAAA